MAKSKPQKKETHRQPIVAILGHVDHGKTTLLDHIRKTRRAEKEVGGITQSIGAYQAEFQNKKITFIDTPGHAAFSKMRSQGAGVADIVVLVVAADDGVKPQTVESVKHIKNAKVPLIVAVTKMDKEGVTAETAKAQLTEHEIFVEGYGGNTPVVELSAKDGKNIDSLLENILILSELEEIPYLPEKPLQAVIIESMLDPKRGPIASVVVKEGTLKVKEDISTGNVSGKAKALFSDSGQSINEALPGEPAQILGFNDVPAVGSVVEHASEKNIPKEKEKPENVQSESKSEGKLNIIIKSDTVGSLDAIKESITDDINIVSESTGDIGEADVLLARTTGSIIVGFNAKASKSVLTLAETEEVIIKTYDIIYELLEYLEKKVLRMLEPTIDEEVLGEAEVLKIFDFGKMVIAGCKVTSGKIEEGDTVHLKRDDKPIKDARIKSIKIEKEDVKTAKSGQECGILLSPQLDLKKKDIILSYRKSKTDLD